MSKYDDLNLGEIFLKEKEKAAKKMYQSKELSDSDKVNEINDLKATIAKLESKIAYLESENQRLKSKKADTKKSLTAEQIDEIKKLYKRGYTKTSIAQKYEISVSSVTYHVGKRKKLK